MLARAREVERDRPHAGSWRKGSRPVDGERQHLAGEAALRQILGRDHHLRAGASPFGSSGSARRSVAGSVALRDRERGFRRHLRALALAHGVDHGEPALHAGKTRAGSPDARRVPGEPEHVVD